ncbi:hypothetical protein [Cohnella zeiphila]|uniref:Uncharacterized protein n=1 Tax=Cohnella zeiphila TaxID=2761120 RepID=A0A7X0VXF3_9BACL|nr:hypothetical protein [Cohnella zeiphila]MBB6733540.1 hypothetical protein [Cohnella zeiphila]
MLPIRKASFRRMAEQGGGRYAEIEVETEDPHCPRLLAHFRREGGGRYQLVRVFRPTEETASSPGGRDATFELFAGPDRGGAEDRAGFGRRLLAYGDIRDQLDRHLQPNG